eukprot:ANDGO_07542.mRNA.1 putative AAA domain-containing protein C16E9.10c
MAKNRKARGPLGFDSQLIPRIKEFSSVDSLKDVDSVVEHLRKAYPEYCRKPLLPFRLSVSRAVEILFKNAQKNGEGSTDSSEVEDREDDVRRPDFNLLNSSLRNGYKIDAESALSANGGAAVSAEPVEVEKSVLPKEGKPAKNPVNPADREGEAPKQRPAKAMKRNASSGLFTGSSGSERLVVAERPSVSYVDLGGMEHALQEVRELIEYPLTHPEIYVHLGVEPPRGILLHGPPGCGKTLLANAIAGELGIPFYKVSAPEVVSGMSGESEAKLRNLFADAIESAPSIIFIDEIDAITPKRENAQREMERRIVAQLLTCMDGLSLEATSGKPVLVIGATNRPDSLDSALRRAGRFDREIALGIPDEASRGRILKVMCERLRLSGDFDFLDIARRTPGFVGADLSALTKEAAVICVNRIFRQLFPSTSAVVSTDSNAGAAGGPSKAAEASLHAVAIRSSVSDALRRHAEPLTSHQLDTLSITMADFEEAIHKVQPSSKREGFATIPDVSWSDIGALHDVRAELQLSIMEPIRSPEKFEALGLSAPTGVLLYGPPGCGKTLLAKAIAHESGASFISIKGPELLNKYVGESERAVRQVFARGRASAPCVIFFDELDALCPRRGGDSSNSQSSERVVNQLLTEMDGLDGRRNVFVIAATNRPDIIDPAMLRPGRLDKLLYVPLPRPAERASILQTLTRHTPLSRDVQMERIAFDSRLEGFSGADLAGFVREASVAALKEVLHDPSRTPEVGLRHFEHAFAACFPSVSKKDERAYNALKSKIRRVRVLSEDANEATKLPGEDADATSRSVPVNV